MGALLIISALAAQVSTAAPSPAPPATATPASDNSTMGASTYVDLEAGAGYGTNPNLRFGDNTGSGFGRISANAVHTRISARTTTVFSAFAQEILYTSHYSSGLSLDLNARHSARVSEKLQLFGDVDFAYDKGGQLDTRILGVPNVPLAPGSVLPPELLVPGGDFLSVTGRQYRASAHLGGQVALSARDYLTASAGIEHSVFKGAGLETRYTTIPLSLGYDRQISTRTTIGARLSATRTDYDGPGTVWVVTPQATIQTALSDRLTFTGALGVSYSSIDDGLTTRHSTGVAADAALCSRGDRDQFCARAAINQEQATAAGPARNMSVGVDYSRRLDADQTIRFSLDGSRYSSPTSFITGQTFSTATYGRAAADYTRRLGDRWFAGATVAARKLTERGPDPRADLSGSLFIRYRLGDLR
jgi:hypothetical protein